VIVGEIFLGRPSRGHAFDKSLCGVVTAWGILLDAIGLSRATKKGLQAANRFVVFEVWGKRVSLIWQQNPEESTQIWPIKPLFQSLKRERFAKARHFKKRVPSPHRS
jgi:hypothetical protein